MPPGVIHALNTVSNYTESLRLIFTHIVSFHVVNQVPWLWILSSPMRCAASQNQTYCKNAVEHVAAALHARLEEVGEKERDVSKGGEKEVQEIDLYSWSNKRSSLQLGERPIFLVS